MPSTTQRYKTKPTQLPLIKGTERLSHSAHPHYRYIMRYIEFNDVFNPLAIGAIGKVPFGTASGRMAEMANHGALTKIGKTEYSRATCAKNRDITKKLNYTVDPQRDEVESDAYKKGPMWGALRAEWDQFLASLVSVHIRRPSARKPPTTQLRLAGLTGAHPKKPRKRAR